MLCLMLLTAMWAGAVTTANWDFQKNIPDGIQENTNYQGVAVMNFTEREIPYTRVIEHKHFEFGTQPVTYVTKEYPADWQPGEEAYYPVNNDRNQELYQQYAKLAEQEDSVIFGGRLAEYKYYDMDDVIKSALERAAQE